MNILIFGTDRPVFDLKQDPKNGLLIQCKNDYHLSYDPQKGLITWEDVILNTRPYLVDNIYTFRAGVADKNNKYAHQLNEAFDEALGKLMALTGSAEEKDFLKKYAAEYTDSENPAWALKGCPALIPQVWVNLIHYSSDDKERASRVQREPQRVDFICFFQNRKIIFEIDGQSHFSEVMSFDEQGVLLHEPSMEQYTLHLKKDRWLRKEGWEVWRFSTKEIREENVTSLLDGIIDPWGVPF